MRHFLANFQIGEGKAGASFVVQCPGGLDHLKGGPHCYGQRCIAWKRVEKVRGGCKLRQFQPEDQREPLCKDCARQIQEASSDFRKDRQKESDDFEVRGRGLRDG